MQSDPIVKVIDEEDGRKAAAAGAGQRRIVMSRRRSAAAQPHAIRIVDEGYGVIVADSPELLWDALQGALRRRQESPRVQRAAPPGPMDFADAMRRVEDEVYDAD
jgi:hypothetical protein